MRINVVLITCNTNRIKKKSYGSIVCEKNNFGLCPVPPPYVLTLCTDASHQFFFLNDKKLAKNIIKSHIFCFYQSTNTLMDAHK